MNNYITFRVGTHVDLDQYGCFMCQKDLGLKKEIFRIRVNKINYWIMSDRVTYHFIGYCEDCYKGSLKNFKEFDYLDSEEFRKFEEEAMVQAVMNT